MSRYLGWFFLAVLMLALSAPLQALNYEVGGCKTGSSWVNFTTISAAVTGVPAGATIQVCPGVYPEQVTITQPLTLKGIASGNANRAVITINPNGSQAPNVTGIYGPFYAQVLVQNVSPAGAVNITGVTVDGNGLIDQCASGTEFFAGIFYPSGTSGTVNEVTARNQQLSGCGWGIWAENGNATSQAITVKNSSVHEGGIVALTCQNPPTLTATISGNFVTSSIPAHQFDFTGNIALQGANGSVTGNVLAGGGWGLVIGNDIFCPGGGATTVSQNTFADLSWGIGLENANGAITSNQMSNVSEDFVFLSPETFPTTIKSNTAMNSNYGVWFPVCGTNWTIKGNTFNDAFVAFWGAPSSITGNSLYNIDTIQTGSCS
jgi:hypothetical protein